MTKFNALLLLTLVLISAKAAACSCSPRSRIDKFHESQFVAKAKILNVQPDQNNKDYHDADIQIITLYKGELIKKVKIYSALNSSCSFLPAVNSTWIIYASKWQGMLSFNYCSGSLNLDRAFDPVEYPNANWNYKQEIELEQEVLAYLGAKKITSLNPSGLSMHMDDLNILRGYKNKNRLAVFQVDVASDLSISRIKPLRKFQNGVLNKVVVDRLKSKLKFDLPPGKTESTATHVLLFCYYYRDLPSGPGFVTF